MRGENFNFAVDSATRIFQVFRILARSRRRGFKTRKIHAGREERFVSEMQRISRRHVSRITRAAHMDMLRESVDGIGRGGRQTLYTHRREEGIR